MSEQVAAVDNSPPGKSKKSAVKEKSVTSMEKESGSDQPTRGKSAVKPGKEKDEDEILADEAVPQGATEDTDGTKKVLKKAKTGKSLSVQRLGTVKIFSARRKRDCRTETADPLRKVMKKKVVKPKIEKAAAMQIVSNIKSDLEVSKTVPEAENPLVESSLLSSPTSLEKSTPKTIGALHKKKPKVKVVKNLPKKSNTSGETDEKEVNSPKRDMSLASKKPQRTLSTDSRKDLQEKKVGATKKATEVQKPKRTVSTDTKSGPQSKKEETVSEKSKNPKRAMSKDGKEEEGEKESRKKVAKDSKDEETPDISKKGKQSVKGKGSAQTSTDSKAVVTNKKSQKRTEEAPPNPKGSKNKSTSQDEEDADKDGEKKVDKKIMKEAPKAAKTKQPEKEKATKATASKKGAETSKAKDEGNKEEEKKVTKKEGEKKVTKKEEEKKVTKKAEEKKVAKKGASSDDTPVTAPSPAADKVKDDTKKNNKNVKPSSPSKKAVNPDVEAKQNESQATAKGVKRKHEEVEQNTKETKGDSKKAKPILSKKRTRANAPSTRSINIKGVERQNIAKSPTKKKQPAKAPADDVSLAPVSQAEKEERPAKATKNDAKRVKVDEEISFISPKVSKTSVEKPTSGAKKGKSSKVEEQVEGASPVMKLLQAAGRRLGILKK